MSPQFDFRTNRWVFGKGPPTPASAIARHFWLAAQRRGQGRPEGEGEACPVEPNRPLDLSGGAAAALEFDA